LWLVVGLGNPGSRYSRTRHNIGFQVLDELAKQHGLEFREKADYRICNGSIEGDEIVLVEPLTFMNRSGTAVRKLAGKFFVPPERVIVVHDDLDLETGVLKIRRKGSSGGHRGVESVIQSLGSKDFVRVKLGIGRSGIVPAEKYVLSKFTGAELPSVKAAVTEAVEAVHVILTEGVEKAMNRFNSGGKAVRESAE
jgi:peptidyl-tRNA hydrolase, PTH1 family